ncbi:MAG: hypothetical protein AAFP76_00020 [Bacteroidota bacterium]
MVVLKKIRAGTIVETLLASVIIMVVFSYASLSLNGAFAGVIRHKDTAFQNRIKELVYLLKNDQLEVPFYEDTDSWDIQIQEKEGAYHLTTLYKPTESEKEIAIYEAY